MFDFDTVVIHFCGVHDVFLKVFKVWCARGLRFYLDFRLWRASLFHITDVHFQEMQYTSTIYLVVGVIQGSS